ncbi:MULTISPECIES: glycoside hydrolase family 32 protein [Microbacterium]|uniref:glycoside hydrolase family 32 protein n=1 Tax=Microbacterium TaxID=33882 RepID=UPI000D6454F7|nr:MULTISPECIES: glycoside hydrolase family 32 protein [Microbacterium]
MHTQNTRFAAPRRLLVLVAAVGAAIVLVVALAVALSPRGGTDSAPSPSASTPEESPADRSPHRPAVHLTPERDWMNDPQKPFLLDGVWHYYYLYNADYPEGNGTAWYHATSTDLVHWEDQGVAIEKYGNGLGDIWTGTAVVDHQGTAGFGAGAVVAIVTQQVDGVQRQSLFVSQDGGYSFESYDGNPIMENPGVADWRDPRVFWDESAGHWVMALAEHDRIGFYTSPNLREWTYTSDFRTTDLGVLECPDLFPMAADGDPGDVRWVLLAGANGAAESKTTGTAYWVGDWDGERFAADGSGHQWLDHGPDYYAAVTWDDPRLDESARLSTRYSIGWMNNWAYAGDFPTDEWHGGSDSIIREITLVSDHGRAQLRSAPASELAVLEGDLERIDDVRIGGERAVELEAPASGAYRVRLDASSEAGELRVKVVSADGSFATVGYDFAAQTAFVARDTDAVSADMPAEYRTVRTAPVTSSGDRIALDIVVDTASIEVFAGDGQAALTMATFGSAGPRDVRIEAARDAVVVADASLTPLRAAPVAREGHGR